MEKREPCTHGGNIFRRELVGGVRDQQAGLRTQRGVRGQHADYSHKNTAVNLYLSDGTVTDNDTLNGLHPLNKTACQGRKKIEDTGMVGKEGKEKKTFC
jgi:hypothetical protein